MTIMASVDLQRRTKATLRRFTLLRLKKAIGKRMSSLMLSMVMSKFEIKKTEAEPSLKKTTFFRIVQYIHHLRKYRQWKDTQLRSLNHLSVFPANNTESHRLRPFKKTLPMLSFFTHQPGHSNAIPWKFPEWQPPASHENLPTEPI